MPRKIYPKLLVGMPRGTFYSGGPRYLYAVEFADGRVKIGYTQNPAERAKQLMCAQKRCITRAVCRQLPARGYRQVEAEALRRAARIGNKSEQCSEMFTDLKFGEAVNLVVQVVRTKGAPKVKLAKAA